jgi:hypothetical protein
MMREEICQSCGLPMHAREDHAGGDPHGKFCTHCATPEGNLYSYEHVLTALAGFLHTSEGMPGEAARDLATDVLARQPAWSTRS